MYICMLYHIILLYSLHTITRYHKYLHSPWSPPSWDFLFGKKTSTVSCVVGRTLRTSFPVTNLKGLESQSLRPNPNALVSNGREHARKREGVGPSIGGNTHSDREKIIPWMIGMEHHDYLTILWNWIGGSVPGARAANFSQGACV